MLCCVIVNESTIQFDGLTADWLEQCAIACNTQLSRDVAPVYGGTYVVRVGTADTVAPGEMVFAIVDSLPDAPGAVAYHDVNGGDVPVAFLALSTCKTLDDVSTAISHELVETAGDAACDLWVDDGYGSEWARELCDAVESNGYPIAGIMMSDFLLPAFFGPTEAGPWNYMGAVASTTAHADPTGPFETAAGGYQIKRTAGTGEAQVTGQVREHRVAKLHHWSSRPFRRGA